MEARELLMTEDDRVAMGGTAMLDDNYNAALQRRWHSMLEGITDPWLRRCTAILMENEMRYVGGLKRKLEESTLSGNIPDIVKLIFPLIRRVWPNLVANNLVSLQPMDKPIGGIFYWEYKYGTTKGLITAGQNMIENFDPYYSSEYVKEESIYSGSATDNFTGTLTWKPVQPYSMGRTGIIFTGLNASGVAKTIYDSNASGTLTGDVGATSTLNFVTGAYDITFDTSDIITVTANYYVVMEGQSDNVPQVNVDITLDPIKAWSRKLKVLWSSEAADDMRAVLNMDIEPELTAGVASEIALGIDRELIDAMYMSGTTNLATFDAAVPPGRNEVDHYRNITTPLSKISGAINTATHRGPGNFLIFGPDVQPIFEALWTHGDLRPIYTDAGGGRTPGQGVTGRTQFSLPQAPSGYGIYAMGTLQSKWTAIVDPYFTAGKILVGLKGPLFPDAGLAYSPYVPLEMTSAFLDPADFTLRKGMRTRYAKKLTNNKFFGIATVQNTP